MAANFKIKFMFADAFTIEEEFPPPTTVAEAKTKLISSWPAGWAPTGRCAPRAACWRTRCCASPRVRGKVPRGLPPCAQPASQYVHLPCIRMSHGAVRCRCYYGSTGMRSRRTRAANCGSLELALLPARAGAECRVIASQ